MSIKKIHFGFIIVALILPIAGVLSVKAVNSLISEREIMLKKEMAPNDAEKAVRMIGIYSNNFEAEMTDAKTKYIEEYGEQGFDTVSYKGHTLLIPPSINSDKIEEAKLQVDNIVIGQNSSRPNEDIQDSQIFKIREVFGVTDSIIYNAELGAYTDEKGFQYNFEDGELISKQIGVTNLLNEKFEEAYPHFKPDNFRNAVISIEKAKANSDYIVGKIFANDQINNLINNVQYIDLGDARAGFVYGDKEIHALVDLITGDVINFNKSN